MLFFINITVSYERCKREETINIPECLGEWGSLAQASLPAEEVAIRYYRAYAGREKLKMTFKVYACYDFPWSKVAVPIGSPFGPESKFDFIDLKKP